ncbi:MAG: aspartate kinase [Clostridia bacterium]|nr:aspartate kinase [Clostridia bacterium]
MKLIVQKFGGTSVATPEGREKAIQRVLEAKAKGFAPVVVVSAMGRNGAPYATDTLINLVREIDRDVQARELDLLTACGEIISSVVMAQSIKAKGCPAIALTGGQAGIRTDANFGNAQILEINPNPITRLAKAGQIVVVAGFQGVTEDGGITTLGRGGSDTTATALGVALKAEEVEIYTDVDGVMTVDPRVVPEAQILDRITYREICEMAYQGAKVIHPRAVEIAMTEQVPIRIKNTFSDAEGTLIAQGAAERVITGLAHLTNLVQVGVALNNGKSSQANEVEVFKLLADNGISIDLISVLPKGIYFTVKEEAAEKATGILSEAGFEYTLQKDCGKLSVIGAGMTNVPGVMANLMGTLHRAGVEILQTSDSEITISFLVPMEQLNKAVQLLHNKFALGQS